MRNYYEERFASGVHERQPVRFAATACPAWLCCAMDYSLSLDCNNKVGRFQGPFKTTFYPFQRGFFTKFEQRLDDEILDSKYPPGKTTSTPPQQTASQVPAVAGPSSSTTFIDQPLPIRQKDNGDPPKKATQKRKLQS